MSEIIPRHSDQQSLSNRQTARDAQAMYRDGHLPTEISEALNIPFQELSKRIFGPDGTGSHPKCWHYLRDQARKKKDSTPPPSVQTFEKTKYYFLKQTEARLLNLVKKSLAEFDKDKTLLYDMDGIKKALDALGKLDNISRLEEGKPTQHLEISHGLSLSEVAKKYGSESIPTTVRHLDEEE